MKAPLAKKNVQPGKSRVVVDPLATPLVPPRCNQIPQGGSFVRDKECGAGQVSRQQKADSLLRRAGHR